MGFLVDPTAFLGRSSELLNNDSDMLNRMATVLTRSLSSVLVLGLLMITAVAGSPLRAEASGEGSRFVPISPARVLDTRDGTGAVAGVRASNSITTLSIAGTGQIPTDAVAVVLNATVTESSGAGFVSLYPTGVGTPGATSNLNVAGAGSTIANTVIVPVGTDGQVSILMNVGGHMLLDVFGYFEPAPVSISGRFQGLPEPTRVLDTRSDTGTRLAANSTLRLPVFAGVSAVVVNVTAVGADTGGFLQLYPSLAGTKPGAHSNVNYTANDAAPNLAIVPVGTDSSVTIYTSAAVHVIVDVIGYFTGSDAPELVEGLFVPITPERVRDTRQTGPIAPGLTDTVNVAELGGLGTSAAAVFVNATIVDAAKPGYLQLYPTEGGTAGASSNVNVAHSGDTRPNAAITGLTSGQVNVFHEAGGHYLLDLAGYFTTSTFTPGTTPAPPGSPTPGDGGTGDLLDALTVAPPNTTVTYSRSDWPHWSTVACQDTRARVLIRDSTTSVTFNETGCRVVAGSWTDPWTGLTYTLAANVDIDHTVPLANAHRSGGWAWDREDKRAFANDMTNPAALRPMGSSANRSKGDRGPDEWRPPLEDTWCDYATDWATIKITWDLTVTVTEHAALDEMLDTC